MVKKPKTLKDFDDKTLDIIEKRVAPKESQREDVDPVILRKYRCPSDHCDGLVEKVKPAITMDTLQLFECPTCKERIYLQSE